MVVSLPPDLERLVQRQVESGKYTIAIEAIFAGMHLLDQQDETELASEQLELLQREINLEWTRSPVENS